MVSMIREEKLIYNVSKMEFKRNSGKEIIQITAGLLTTYLAISISSITWGQLTHDVFYSHDTNKHWIKVLVKDTISKFKFITSADWQSSHTVNIHNKQ